MLSLRCRINANVAELLVIIGYSRSSDLRSELVRSLSAARSAACLPACPPALPLSPDPPPVHPGFASSPVWSFPRLPASLPRPRPRRALARTGALLGGPIHSPPRRHFRFTRSRTAIRDQLEQIFGCSCSIGNAYLPR